MEIIARSRTSYRVDVAWHNPEEDFRIGLIMDGTCIAMMPRPVATKLARLLKQRAGLARDRVSEAKRFKLAKRGSVYAHDGEVYLVHKADWTYQLAPAEAEELANEVERQVRASMDDGQMIGLGRMGRLYRLG